MQDGDSYRVFVPQCDESVLEFLLDVLGKIGIIGKEPRRSDCIHNTWNDIVDTVEFVGVCIKNGTVVIIVVFIIVKLIADIGYSVDFVASWLPDAV